MNKEKIKKILDCDDCKFATCETCEITYTDRKKIKDYIQQLESKVKSKEKYIQSLEEHIKNLESEE